MVEIYQNISTSIFTEREEKYNMKAKIMMICDGPEYEYGTYAFETDEQKNRVNELAMKNRDERDIPVYVHPCT